MQVLIVDDSQFALSMLKKLLTENGYDVLTATNGKEGLEALRQYPSCRIVIADGEMPIMNGFDFCQEVRALDCPEYIYFIFLACFGQLGDIERAVFAGADDYIVKPYNPAEVLARLRVAERLLSFKTNNWQ